MGRDARRTTLVARQILARMETDLAGEYDFTAARRDNAAGWTVWAPAPLGGEVVTTGVTLGDEELHAAWRRAATWYVAAPPCRGDGE